jgi:GalNAc-alpha-(1->4)-GalNAc-alpha-(1->3)-diNAcBac-PP-undecaprenol alpha-1,4-N-acetyl-D-galactosaminyltransferase
VLPGDSHKVRICLAIHGLIAGGMENVMAHLARHFAAKPEVDLNILVYGHNRELFYPLPGKAILHTPSFVFSNRMRFISTVRTLAYVRRTIRRIHPDVILSFGEYWNSFILLALLGLPVPVYVSDRSRPDKYLGRWQEFLRKRLYPSAAGIIAQTATAASIASGAGRNKNIRIIGNPIRSMAFPGNESRENIVLTVGRMVHTKHLDRLIDIFTGLDAKEWKLLIVGGDAQRQGLMQELKQQVESLDARDRILFEGYRKEIGSYYRRSKVFAFTSSSEGFPNVLAEALAAGLPAVSYDCVAGPSELIENGKNGFLVPLFDDVAFAEKLTTLMMDEPRRRVMSENAFHSVERYRPEEIGESYYSFLTESLSE